VAPAPNLPAPAARRPVTLAGTLRAYLALTKPRIIELLLVTALPTMVLAAGRLPAPRPLLGVLLGGGLAAGGANALNCYLDRDVDRLMRRTARRPLPSGAVSDRSALVFGVALMDNGAPNQVARKDVHGDVPAQAAAAAPARGAVSPSIKPRKKVAALLGGSKG